MLTEVEARREAARLLSDRDYFLSTVVENNPEAVASNLRTLGYEVNSIDEIIEAITQLENEGATEAIFQVINVEPNFTNLQPGYERVFEILSILKNSKK
jgi:hypothetical protein